MGFVFVCRRVLKLYSLLNNLGGEGLGTFLKCDTIFQKFDQNLSRTFGKDVENMNLS